MYTLRHFRPSSRDDDIEENVVDCDPGQALSTLLGWWEVYRGGLALQTSEIADWGGAERGGGSLVSTSHRQFDSGAMGDAEFTDSSGAGLLFCLKTRGSHCPDQLSELHPI
jgi:hypothetical protein